jgi:hypothetical protein
LGATYITQQELVRPLTVPEQLQKLIQEVTRVMMLMCRVPKEWKYMLSHTDHEAVNWQHCKSLN